MQRTIKCFWRLLSLHLGKTFGLSRVATPQQCLKVSRMSLYLESDGDANFTCRNAAGLDLTSLTGYWRFFLPEGKLKEFVAVEVQAIDTTGNYRAERQAHMDGAAFSRNSPAGINWENVSKRILPQLIYKGHVLRREPLCRKGLFFVCPTPVYQKISGRLGGNLLEYAQQPGALTFRWYDLGPDLGQGTHRDVVMEGQLTTTVDQVANAFTSPTNLPAAGVYQQAIESELGIR
jgi:hypothetical protein